MPRPKGSQNKVTAEVKEAHKRNLNLKEYFKLLLINFFLAPLATQSLKIELQK